MKIFFIGSQFNHPKSGGEIYNSKMVQYLRDQGADLIPIDFPWGSVGQQLKFDFSTAKIIRATASKQKVVVIFDESLHQRMWLTLLTILLSRNVLSIIMLHQLSYMKRTSKLYHTFSKLVGTFILRRCDAAISAGQYVGNIAADLAESRNKVKFALTTLQAASDKAIDKEKYCCVYAGTVTERKGLIYAIEAINLLPEQIKDKLTVDVLGQTSDDKYFQTVTSALDSYKLVNKFKFHGHQNVDTLARYFQRANVFLFPSLWDNMPMVLLEAMGYGCIPVAFNNSGTALYVREGETGLLANDQDAAHFANKLEALFSVNESTTEKLRANAINESRKFQRGWEEVGRDFYEAVLSL